MELSLAFPVIFRASEMEDVLLGRPLCCSNLFMQLAKKIDGIQNFIPPQVLTGISPSYVQVTIADRALASLQINRCEAVTEPHEYS
jgi:hypothetical protein